MNAQDYLLRTNKHRPQNDLELQVEILRLYEAGLLARDIGAAIGVPPDVVVNVLHSTLSG